MKQDKTWNKAKLDSILITNLVQLNIKKMEIKLRILKTKWKCKLLLKNYWNYLNKDDQSWRNGQKLFLAKGLACAKQSLMGDYFGI